jgi:hypothetical protein
MFIFMASTIIRIIDVSRFVSISIFKMLFLSRYTFYFIQLLNKIVNKTYLCRSIYYTVLYKFYIISSILFKNQFKKNLNVANLPNASIGVFYFNICPMIGSVMVSYSICLRFGMNLVWGLDPLYSASAFVRGLDPCLRLYLLFSDSAYVQGVNPLNKIKCVSVYIQNILILHIKLIIMV